MSISIREPLRLAPGQVGAETEDYQAIGWEALPKGIWHFDVSGPGWPPDRRWIGAHRFTGEHLVAMLQAAFHAGKAAR